MFDVFSTILDIHVVGGENHFEIPFPARGVITRIILVETGSAPSGIVPVLDIYESNRSVDYSSSSGGAPTEHNEELHKTFDPHCYKVCPQLTGVSQGGKGLLEVFAESGGYSFYCQDAIKPAIGQGGIGGQNAKKLYGKITLGTAGPAQATSWNLCLQALLKG